MRGRRGNGGFPAEIEDPAVPMPEREGARPYRMGHGAGEDQQQRHKIARRSHGLGKWTPGYPGHRVLDEPEPTPEDQDPGPVSRKQPVQREGRPDIVGQKQHSQRD
jgi:hypothetical protein